MKIVNMRQFSSSDVNGFIVTINIQFNYAEKEREREIQYEYVEHISFTYIQYIVSMHGSPFFPSHPTMLICLGTRTTMGFCVEWRGFVD